MALSEKPDPRRKLMMAAVIDFIIIAFGVTMFVSSGNMVWILGAVIVATIIAAPLMISAVREMKEQNDASR